MPFRQERATHRNPRRYLYIQPHRHTPHLIIYRYNKTESLSEGHKINTPGHLPLPCSLTEQKLLDFTMSRNKASDKRHSNVHWLRPALCSYSLRLLQLRRETGDNTFRRFSLPLLCYAGSVRQKAVAKIRIIIGIAKFSIDYFCMNMHNCKCGASYPFHTSSLTKQSV